MGAERRRGASGHHRVNRPLRITLQTLNVLAAVAAIGVTLVLCGGSLFFAALTGDTFYNQATTAAGWIAEVIESAETLLLLSTVLAVALIIACVAAVAATLLRRTMWIIVGGFCGVLLVAAQIGVFAARAEFKSLANSAVAAVGNTVALQPRAPAEPEKDPITMQDARDEMTRMLDATFAASVAPVVDEDGVPVTADDVELIASACGERGSRLTAAIRFTTGANAESLVLILRAWDREEYAPDRAVGEDLRYSSTLPLERMSIRDETTVDGLIQMSIVSACATVDR